VIPDIGNLLMIKRQMEHFQIRSKQKMLMSQTCNTKIKATTTTAIAATATAEYFKDLN
jgi:hypothetical protein